jgi:hypothetical protein
MDVRIDEAAAWVDVEHEAGERVAVARQRIRRRKMRK